ncbi:MAG: hypothetical protein AAB436_01635 [Patescibacteria group bacterium]
MDTNLLTASTNTGTQTSTQSPQTAGKPSSAAAKASAVQQGTAASVLTAQGGVQLSATPLTTVNLGGSASATATSTVATSVPRQHQINSVSLIFVGILALIAIGSFIAINRSAKNTT